MPVMFRPLLISLCLTSTALATTWTVDDDGKADFDNIQDAIDAASDGDEIIVMPGTYTSTQNGHVVKMLGKAVTLRSSDPSDPDVVAATIIDGEDTRRGIVCLNEETSKTIISGFTVTNGYGCGMYNYQSNSTVTDCTFAGNTSDNNGGGMSNFKSSPTVTDCTFTDNTAYLGGGGMYNNNSSNATLENCAFTNNTTYYYGGGMRNDSSSPTLTGCTFENNTAGLGGGMRNSNSNPTLTECTFENNTATDDGGGMYNENNSSPTLTDTTVCGNTPDQINGDWTDNGGNWVEDECPIVDDDGDGIPDNIDNCYLYNPDQTDCNENEVGDVCDIADGTSYDINDNGIPDECEDSDGDGFPDDMDAFPDDPNEWVDSDGDGMGDNEDLATLGVCCVDSGCDLLAQVTCNSLGGSWLGAKGGGCANCPTICSGDINGDGQVDVNDLLILIAAWGACP